MRGNVQYTVSCVPEFGIRLLFLQCAGAKMLEQSWRCEAGSRFQAEPELPKQLQDKNASGAGLHARSKERSLLQG